MLAPREIINKKFDKSAFGYKVDEVDKYLSAVADDYSKLLSEKNEYEKNMTVLAAKLEEYRKDEGNLSAVLLGAQKLGDSIVKEAKNKAELIIRDAGIKSDKMLEGTHRQLEREKHELSRVQKEVSMFKTKILDLYKSHLEVVSALPEVEEPSYNEIQASHDEQFSGFDQGTDATAYMEQGYGTDESLADLAEGLSIEAELDQAADGESFVYSQDDKGGFGSDHGSRRTPGFVPNLEETPQQEINRPFVFNENFGYEAPYGATDVIDNSQLEDQQSQSKFGELRFGQGFDLTRESDGKKKKKRRI